MNDLVAWLTQILDEDEKAAKRAGGSITSMQNDNYGLLLVPHGWVLDDIAAKRAIITWCGEREQIYVGTIGSDPDRLEKDDFVPGGLANREGHVVLRMLAAAYADRPGYREEWRPLEVHDANHG